MNHRKPRILLVNFEQAGIGSSGLLVADALSKNPNIEVHYLYNAAAAKSPVQWKRLKTIQGAAIKMESRKQRILSYLRALVYCLKFRPDIIHDLGGSAYRKNLPLWPFFAAISRFILTEPAPSKKEHPDTMHRFARRLAHRLAQRFVVFGPSSRDDLLHSGVASEKIFQSRLGHKGFYADLVKEPPARDPNSILFFGEFRPEKGVELLLPMADLVHRHFPKARFVVAGSSHVAAFYRGTWNDRVQQMIKEMRARSYFEVRDEYVCDEDVARLFMSSGMVLLPYFAANQSGVLLTAMALNCPVIASPVGDLVTVVKHGENGLLSTPSAGCFAEAILSLLQNPGQGERLARQARMDVERQFSWEQIVREYPEKLYRLAPE